MKNFLLFFVTSILFVSSLSQYTGCDYYQSVTYGSTFQVYSPSYSAFYAAGTMCRWAAVAPPGYKLVLQCTDVVLPSSVNCQNDRIEVSRTGRADLLDAYRYCGSGTFTEESQSTSMVIALKVPTTSIGGRFYCTLKAVFNPCDCGRRTLTRIVGGTTAVVNEFPMVVGIKTKSPSIIICGGTIISNFFVLTAAHCVANQVASGISVVVGEHDLSTTTESAYTASYDVVSIFSHTGFVSSPSRNDIAVLKTATEIIFNKGVGIVCLPWKYNAQTPVEQFSSTTVVTAGWGTTTFGGPRSNVLLKVVLNTMSTASCQGKLSNILTSHICTYTSGKDTCQYDSGGGLLYTDSTNALLYEIGIVSYGVGCAGTTPGVSTRVTSFLSWILDNTPGASYCSV